MTDFTVLIFLIDVLGISPFLDTLMLFSPIALLLQLLNNQGKQ